MSPSIIQVAVPSPLPRLFDYLVPDDIVTDKAVLNLKPGIRVRISFGRQNLVGIVISTNSKTDCPINKLKPIEEILDDQPIFSEAMLKLCTWASGYYHYPLGEVLSAAIPKLLRGGRQAVAKLPEVYVVIGDREQISSRAKQQLAIYDFLDKSPGGLSSDKLKTYSSSALRSLVVSGIVGKKVAAKFSATNARIRDVSNNKCTHHYEIEQSNNSEGGEVDELFNVIGKDDHLSCVKTLPKLNDKQQEAVTAVCGALGEFSAFLLDGVTGSGKTEVYLQVIEQVLASGKQALVLVPEIGLTPQTVERFKARFDVEVMVFHSGLTDQARLNTWAQSRDAQAKIVIATRSGIFMPMPNLGVIIVDEEHDGSYKQQDTFRYSSRDISVMRAYYEAVPIVLGSATPSLETIHNVNIGRYQYLSLPMRAGIAQKPELRAIDIRHQNLQNGLSKELLDGIKQHIDAGQQVLLFINRRGFAPTLMCYQCGWTAQCQACDARMTLHQKPSYLHCHHCDQRRPAPKVCDNCKMQTLSMLGQGTERVEDAIAEHFPGVGIARIDRDNVKTKQQFENVLNDIHSGDAKILIGTQMLAKGHHFPNVTLVGILDADGGFFSSDFRGIEKMAQLIVQVTGRAGRADKPGQVLIQTRQPDHDILQRLISQPYKNFAEYLLTEREHAMLPPYSHFALLRAEAKTSRQAEDFLHQIKNQIALPKGAVLLGPMPAVMARVAGRYRVQMIIQAGERAALHTVLGTISPIIDNIQTKIRWSLDVDPIDVI